MSGCPQYVNYGAQGICRVEGVRSARFGGAKARDYYLLSPVHQPETSIYLPVDNPLLASKMRPVLTPEEIDRTIRSVRGIQMPRIEDFHLRAQRFSEILSRRDERELLLLVGCLYLRGEQRPQGLSIGDRQTLRQAQRIVEEEFSFSLHLQADQVGAYIRNLLGLSDSR